MTLTKPELHPFTYSSPESSTNAESFEQLLDQYDYEQPQRGQRLAGQILTVSSQGLLADVGLKHEAYVPPTDLDRLSDAIRSGLTPGSSIDLVVLRPSDRDGRLVASISKVLEREDWDKASRLMEQDETVQARVLAHNKGGLVVLLGKVTGFVPQSQVDSIPRRLSEDELEVCKAELIGKTLHLKVIEVDEKRGRLILSEKAARHHLRIERLRELEIGQVITGHVVNLTKFGAFIDLGGVDGMIHISRLSRDYISSPAEAVSIGDEVTVRIDSVDVERERVGLGRVDLIADPWEHMSYAVDDLLTGRVRNITDFGVFVTLQEGIDGLVHKSEMEHYSPQVSEKLLVRVVQVNPDKRRVGLSIDRVTPEEWEAWKQEQDTLAPQEG